MTESYRKKLDKAAAELYNSFLRDNVYYPPDQSFKAGAQFVLDNPPTDAWVKRADVQALVDALKGYEALFEDQVIVRNTDNDHDIMQFLEHGSRLTGHLAACQSALAPFRKDSP